MQTPVAKCIQLHYVRCMKVNTQAHHVPIPRLNNGYYGGLDELINKSYDLGDYI